MNGKNKYIGVAVALAGAATIGIAPRPAAADPSTSADVLGAPVVLETSVAQDGWPQVGPNTTIDIVEASLGRPHLIDDAYADVLVRLRGGVCSGTPITGTVYVVTAAHCVLTDSGEVTRKTVVRDHVRYPAVAVLVDTDYAKHPSAALDAAVLIMAQVIPGPSARIGSALPDSGDADAGGLPAARQRRQLAARPRTTRSAPVDERRRGPDRAPLRARRLRGGGERVGRVGRPRDGSVRVGAGRLRGRPVRRAGR